MSFLLFEDRVCFLVSVEKYLVYDSLENDTICKLRWKETVVVEGSSFHNYNDIQPFLSYKRRRKETRVLIIFARYKQRIHESGSLEGKGGLMSVPWAHFGCNCWRGESMNFEF